ncbi:MAG: hypothetical protein AB7E04_06040 [Desulfobacteraceae bacterium]
MYSLSINTKAYNIGLLMNKFQKRSGKRLKRKIEAFDFEGLQSKLKRLFTYGPRFELSIPWTY